MPFGIRPTLGLLSQYSHNQFSCYKVTHSHASAQYPVSGIYSSASVRETGQWSLPKTSAWILASTTRWAMRSLTRK